MRSVAAALIPVAACVALTACSGTPAQSARSASPLWSTLSPSAGASRTVEPDVTAPLTGLAADAQSAALPAVAVSVLTRSGGPEPSGLSAADLVYEELSDTGTSHLLAVFQSHDAAKVGPVDIARPVDVKLLPVLHSAYAFAGGPTGFTVQVENAGIAGVDQTRTPEAFTGEYTSTTRVLDHVRDVDAPPPVLSHGDDTDPLAEDTKAVTAVTVTPPGETTQAWAWDADDARWRRTSGRGGEIAVANLVVQRTGYKTIRNPRLTGGATHTALATGRGDCVAFGRGERADCTWSRPARGQQTNYADSTGAALLFQPGSTWVLLAPPGTEVAAT